MRTQFAAFNPAAAPAGVVDGSAATAVIGMRVFGIATSPFAGASCESSRYMYPVHLPSTRADVPGVQSAGASLACAPYQERRTTWPFWSLTKRSTRFSPIDTAEGSPAYVVGSLGSADAGPRSSSGSQPSEPNARCLSVGFPPA